MSFPLSRNHMILSQAPAGLLPKAVSLYMGAMRTSRQPIKPRQTRGGPLSPVRFSRDNPCHDSRDSVQFTNSTNLEINSQSGCPLFGQHPVSRHFMALNCVSNAPNEKDSACCSKWFGIFTKTVPQSNACSSGCVPDPGLSAYPIGSSPEGITFKTCMGANIPPT